MPFPWVIPHQDGAGTIEVVGEGVPTGRVGERVWVYEATWNRPGGATVLATVSSDEKAHVARTAGAAHTINYRQQDVAAEIQRLTSGTVASYASRGDDTPSVPFRMLMVKNVTYTPSSCTPCLSRPRRPP